MTKEEWAGIVCLLDTMTDDEAKAHRLSPPMTIMVREVPDGAEARNDWNVEFRVVVRGTEGAWSDSLVEALHATRERVLAHARSSLGACEKAKRRHEEQIRKLTGET